MRVETPTRRLASQVEEIEMPSSDVRTWIDAPVGEVVATATDPTRLADWYEVATPVAADAHTDLGRVGTRLEVAWLGGTGAGWVTTTRRRRDVVHLEAVHEDGPVGHLVISLSPWDGGTQAELRADLDGWPVRARTLRRSLHRSLERLEAAVVASDAPARATASPPGRSLRVTPEHDAGMAPTS